MGNKISQDQAKANIVGEYRKLYEPLIDLVGALQGLEPGGTLVDDIVIGKKARVAYAAHPVMLTIRDSNRTFILQVVEEDNKMG